MTNSHQQQQQPTAPVMPAKSWDQLAQERLIALLSRINAVTELHREAEAIHRALTAYGRTDVPALPWVQEPKPRAPRGPHRPIGERCCEGCGVTFTAKHAAARFCGMSCANRATAIGRRGRAADQEAG